MRRAARGTPRRKRTRGQKHTFLRPAGDANGRARTIWASVLRRPVGDALTPPPMSRCRAAISVRPWQIGGEP
jgi:hypothetical protein